jgi:hypothetical protein
MKKGIERVAEIALPVEAWGFSPTKKDNKLNGL